MAFPTETVYGLGGSGLDESASEKIYAAKGVLCEFEVDDAARFHGETGDLQELLGNLLENAIEELSQKKDPPREIHLGLYCRPDCNVVLCEDTGRGIDPAIRDTIFIKGVSSKGENRGIGLYAIHELVERYHGTIEIESEKNEGTEITLTFTRREEKEV